MRIVSFVVDNATALRLSACRDVGTTNKGLACEKHKEDSSNPIESKYELRIEKIFLIY
jgi:hypothetical protein